MGVELPWNFCTKLESLLGGLLCVNLCEHKYHHEDGFELGDLHV